MVASFLVVCSILQRKMSQSDSLCAHQDDEFFCVLLNQILIECPSDILDVLIFLTNSEMKVYKIMSLKKRHFSHAIEVLLDSS